MSSKFPPVKRKRLEKFFTDHGWGGPHPGGKHQFMRKGARKQTLYPGGHFLFESWGQNN